MPLDFTDDKSTLFQVMAWCRQATSHYLSQCWLRSLSPYGVTRSQWVNVKKAFLLVENIYKMSICMKDKIVSTAELASIYARSPTDIASSKNKYIYIYTPFHTKLWEGILVSLHPFVCPYAHPSICATSRVCSVALVGSILYLYILSSNFRRCVACQVSCKALAIF